jgi:hypothetical protein
MDAQQLVDDAGPGIGRELDTEIIAKSLPIETTETVSEEHFEEIVLAALDCVGGIMLFKMTTGSGDDTRHVAAGAVYDGDARHFLILSMPVSGGPLQVEQAVNSKSPIAAIAASYASLADIFGTA